MNPAPSTFLVLSRGTIRVLILRMVALSLLAGCSQLSTEQSPAADFSRIKQIHIESRLNDNHQIDRLIAASLQSLGYTTSVGPLTMLPETADAVLAYEDEWTHDFTRHMVSLEVQVRDARTNRKLSVSRYYRPSITRKSPKEMTHEVIGALFKSR